VWSEEGRWKRRAICFPIMKTCKANVMEGGQYVWTFPVATLRRYAVWLPSSSRSDVLLYPAVLVIVTSHGSCSLELYTNMGEEKVRIIRQTDRQREGGGGSRPVTRGQRRRCTHTHTHTQRASSLDKRGQLRKGSKWQAVISKLS
jgi:hypothetical protein